MNKWLLAAMGILLFFVLAPSASGQYICTWPTDDLCALDLYELNSSCNLTLNACLLQAAPEGCSLVRIGRLSHPGCCDRVDLPACGLCDTAFSFVGGAPAACNGWPDDPPCTGPDCVCTGTTCECVGPNCQCTGAGCTPCEGVGCDPPCSGSDCECQGDACGCVGADCECIGPDCTCNGADCGCIGPDCTCNGADCGCLGPNCDIDPPDCGLNCCMGPDCGCTGPDCECIGPDCGCTGPNCDIDPPILPACYGNFPTDGGPYFGACELSTYCCKGSDCPQCVSDLDCASGNCQRSASDPTPAGKCELTQTIACRAITDCPAGEICVNQPGVCGQPLSCTTTSDCPGDNGIFSSTPPLRSCIQDTGSCAVPTCSYPNVLCDEGCRIPGCSQGNCEDQNAFTKDICHNAGTCQAYCEFQPNPQLPALPAACDSTQGGQLATAMNASLPLGTQSLPNSGCCLIDANGTESPPDPGNIFVTNANARCVEWAVDHSIPDAAAQNYRCLQGTCKVATGVVTPAGNISNNNRPLYCDDQSQGKTWDCTSSCFANSGDPNDNGVANCANPINYPFCENGFCVYNGTGVATPPWPNGGGNLTTNDYQFLTNGMRILEIFDNQNGTIGLGYNFFSHTVTADKIKGIFYCGNGLVSRFVCDDKIAGQDWGNCRGLKCPYFNDNENRPFVRLFSKTQTRIDNIALDGSTGFSAVCNPTTPPGNYAPNGTESAARCTDCLDNDCGGIIDEADITSCCVPSGIENCTDGTDNDCDGLIDCADLQCSSVCGSDSHLECRTNACVLIDGPGVNACSQQSPGENTAVECGDTFDNDSDCLADCADPSCSSSCTNSHTICQNFACTLISGIGTNSCGTVGTENTCNDHFDNDADCLIDCSDVDCQGTPACINICTPQNEICTNETDDDCDSFVDCADYDCSTNLACISTPRHLECVSNSCTLVSDGGGNQDGCTVQAASCSQTCAPTGSETCTGGMDEDCDGLIDCIDIDDCTGDSACVACTTCGQILIRPIAIVQQNNETSLLNEAPALTIGENPLNPLYGIDVQAINHLNQSCATTEIRFFIQNTDIEQVVLPEPTREYISSQFVLNPNSTTIYTLRDTTTSGGTQLSISPNTPPNNLLTKSINLENGNYKLTTAIYCNSQKTDFANSYFTIINGTNPITIPETRTELFVILALAIALILFSGNAKPKK